MWTAVVPDAPVTTWQAAADLGRGVLARAAAVEANRTLPAEEFEEVRAHLTSALAREPRNPVIHYNLGSLLYERYEEAFMHEAIRHFTVAFSASFRDDDPGTTLVAGLALTGHSLAYSQLFHRFGQSDDEVLVNARIAARRAVEMLEELASRTGSPAIRRAVLRAGHAEAMSLHVTEDERDIEDAIAIYEDLVRRWEAFGGPPAVLVNNLAYQHMAFEGRDEPGCNPETYERAARLFERALEIQPDFEMAWANLGNVHRLLKRYDDSERDYREAIAAVERQGKRYPPAHIEFARLLLERGDLAAAEAEYEVALAQTESPSSEAKIHGDWADALRALNQDAAARAAAERGLALWPEEHRCSSVLAKLDAEPTADVDESNMEEAR
ncbi:MAG: tetratricopeptide repeat protein [Acidimicrobiales bacterium]|nr:tetratricopeptide repeat protein [Acidimicrobiales bacterium]